MEGNPLHLALDLLPLELSKSHSGPIQRRIELQGPSVFCDGFGAYDKQARAWRKPLLDALAPKQ